MIGLLLAVAPLLINAPAIDGIFSESEWRGALKIPLASKEEPTIGTTVYLGVDSSNLYVVFICEEPVPQRIVAAREDPDSAVWEDDSVEVFLDTGGDGKAYCHLVANSRGTVYDKYLTPVTCEWTSHARVRTSVDRDCWIAEIAVPWTSLVTSGTKNSWAVNLCRNRRAVEPNQYFTWQGWYHRPKEWAQISFAGIDFPTISSTGAPDFSYPAPSYDTGRLDGLLPELAWIRQERLRLYAGWPTATGKVKGATHTVARFIDKIAESKFNLATVVVDTENPYLFREGLLASIHGRRAGLRLLCNTGYVWSGSSQAKIQAYEGVRRVIDAKGMERAELVCPLEDKILNAGLADRIDKVLAWEDAEGLPGFFSGVLFDMEVFKESRECFCDNCFDGYLAEKGIPERIERTRRKVFLLKKTLLEDYQAWQEERLVILLKRVERDIHKRRPGFLFCFYPYLFNNWTTRAVLKGIGRKDIPALGWDDSTYFTGYSGNAAHVKNALGFTRNYLGYEPLYLPAIDYVTYPKYPAYTPEKAGLEMFLLTCSSSGSVCYGENRPDRNLWESHLPYWPEFRKANERLLRDGIVKSIELQRVDGRLSSRLAEAEEKLAREQNRTWRKQTGSAFFRFDVVQTESRVENRVLLSKTTDSYRGVDHIANGTSAEYVFRVKRQTGLTAAGLKVFGKPQADGDNVFVAVKVNGRPVDDGKPWGKSVEKEISVPLSLIKSKTVVEVAYFNGREYSQTYFDTNFLLERLTLELEEKGT